MAVAEATCQAATVPGSPAHRTERSTYRAPWYSRVERSAGRRATHPSYRATTHRSGRRPRASRTDPPVRELPSHHTPRAKDILSIREHGKRAASLLDHRWQPMRWVAEESPLESSARVPEPGFSTLRF